MPDIGVASDMVELTTFSSDIDLLSGTVGGLVTPTTPPRLIRVIDAGSATLSVVMAASKGVARALTVAAGEEIPGEFTVIKLATNVGRVRVYW